MGKSKTLDEKIKELQEKLKNTELLKKQATQRKGLNLWNRIKILFLEDETIVDELLKDKEKLEIIKENIKKVLNKLFPEKLKKEVKEEKAENNLSLNKTENKEIQKNLEYDLYDGNDIVIVEIFEQNTNISDKLNFFGKVKNEN